MTQIEKLQLILKKWETTKDELEVEVTVARKHNYHLEAMLLDEKYKLIRDICMEIRLKVIEQIMPTY